MSEQVRDMFASIADRYDLTNTVLSLGIHHYWRHVAVNMSQAQPGDHVLDCATGTGDLAIAFKKKVGERGQVLGTDFCAEMMESAPSKARKQGLVIDFEVADAMNLPYENHRFDVCAISFGIRNVDDPLLCLKELARVTKPGGRVVVLEFGQPSGLMSLPFKTYSKYVMPTLGKLLTGNRDAYEYLPETSARFPSGKHFIQLMDKSEVFSESWFKRLNGGIAFVYVGRVS